MLISLRRASVAGVPGAEPVATSTSFHSCSDRRSGWHPSFLNWPSWPCSQAQKPGMGDRLENWAICGNSLWRGENAGVRHSLHQPVECEMLKDPESHSAVYPSAALGNGNKPCIFFSFYLCGTEWKNKRPKKTGASENRKIKEMRGNRD